MNYLRAGCDYPLELALALSLSLQELFTPFATKKVVSKELDAKIEVKKAELLGPSSAEQTKLTALVSTTSSHNVTQKKVVQLARRGILNVGNSCYMNATIQALAECPFLLAVLEKEKGLTSAENPKAEKINNCRKKLREVLLSLQNGAAEKAPFPRAEAAKLLKFFLDLQVTDPAYFIEATATKEKLGEQMDAALFVEFLADYLGLSFKMTHVKLQEGEKVEQLSLKDLVGQAKVAKNQSSPDLLVVCIADRFSNSAKKKRTQVEPSSELPSGYKLCAVICNPSGHAAAGHYMTYAPKREPGAKGWVEYNDSEVTISADDDKEMHAVIEKHSYLYFYVKA